MDRIIDLQSGPRWLYQISTFCFTGRYCCVRSYNAAYVVKKPEHMINKSSLTPLWQRVVCWNV